MAGKVVLVGIDEAGFGPILGPLVVSSTTFSIQRQSLDADWWKILKKSVNNTRKHLAGRLLVADSKKAYSKAIGIKHLQRTTLASLKYLGSEPPSLDELLKKLCPQCRPRLNNYPWYSQIHRHSLSADQQDIAIAAKVFADDLDSNMIKMIDAQSRCLDVAHYNKQVDDVKNKANVLFTAISTLIKRAFDTYGSEQLQIIVDRQGGRVRYRKNLQRMFADMELKILRETPKASSYQLQADGKKMKIHFVVGADSGFFAVSLASMLSKYLRELLIANINNYFTGHYPALKPTAGYWQDGLRFIEDLKNNAPHIKYDSNQLIRSR